MASSIAHVSSRTLVLGLTIAATATPAMADQPPPVRTPQQAIGAVKRVLKQNTRKCLLDWARADAEGYAGNWKGKVPFPPPPSGAGLGQWLIGDGYPVARNALAKNIAHGCSR